MKIRLVHNFNDIISVDNLLSAWKEFIKGKRGRCDVQEFYLNLMDNILELHLDLKNHTYKHGGYQAFNISDPKPRNIHKAAVRDRLLHHAIYRILYPFFERTFIADSYSCRLNKGTHKAISRFRTFACRVSKNHTKTCWVLKCDIKKFFANIDHDILKRIIGEYISDEPIAWLTSRVIDSFYSTKPGVGLPLGNLTSQLFVNIYMNKFDQFMKHKLKVKFFIRYADDFVVFSENKEWLENMIPEIKNFLLTTLRLTPHPYKVYIKTIASGVDFLGWVNFSNYRVLRTTTRRRRMLKKIEVDKRLEVLNSYLGLLKYGNTYKLKNFIQVNIWDGL